MNTLIYRGIYPGIDMTYGGDGRSLKSEFRISPSADPSRIRLRYEGGAAPWIDTDGSLVVGVGDRRAYGSTRRSSIRSGMASVKPSPDGSGCWAAERSDSNSANTIARARW